MDALEEAVYRAAESVTDRVDALRAGDYVDSGPDRVIQVAGGARVTFSDGGSLPVAGHAEALAALPGLLADTVTTWWVD